MIRSNKKRQTKEQVRSDETSSASLDFINKSSLNLDLAGILFVNSYMQIKEGKFAYRKLQKEIVKYKLSYERRAAKFDLESDGFITHQLHKLRDLEVFYEPVVRHFATAKILLVTCAEAFVNEVANAVLKGKSLVEFDKLSPVGKWIFIQDLAKIKGRIGLDSNPLQGFIELVKDRNKLVHFKGDRKYLQILEIPNYLEEYRFTPESCERNFENVRNLLESFSLKWIGSYGPDWLHPDDKMQFRNPCFFLGNRKVATVLYSDKQDKERAEFESNSE